jgi:hypothetical protein
MAWAVGCFVFGAIVVNNSTECRISKQYLCQARIWKSFSENFEIEIGA